jgi:hypothetical protein
MRRLTIIILTIFIGLVFFYSCEEKEKSPVLKYEDTTPPTLKSFEDTSFVLDSANPGKTFGSFTWSAADFGLDVGHSYNLVMDFASNNFSNPTKIASTQNDSATFTVEDINNKLLVMGAQPGKKARVEFRVDAIINEYADTLHSNSITLSFTPYKVIIQYPEIYVPGNYQGWDVATAPPLFDVDNSNIYEGYVLMAVSTDSTVFKFTPERSWEVDYGDAEAGGNQIGDGTLEESTFGADIYLPEDSAYYKLTANIGEMTYEVTKTEWSIQGSATGDQLKSMTYDMAEQVWTITTDLSAGSFTFISKDSKQYIADQNIDIVYGMDNPIYVKEDGEPIPVESAGNFTVTLDLSRPPYGYKVIKN